MSDENIEKNVKVFQDELEEKGMTPYSKIGEIEVMMEGDKRIQRKMFEEVTENVVGQSPTTLNLFQNVLNTIKRFESSGMYKNVDVEFQPGSKKDSVNVKYNLKPSSFYFANISHQFDRFGQASMTSKLGFRNVLGYFDKLTFEYNKALNKSKRSFYNIQWNLPFNFFTKKAQDSFLAQVQHSSTLLDKSCQETKDSFQLVFSSIDPIKETERYSIAFESSLRSNYVSSSHYRVLEDFIPTMKHSIKVSSQAYSSIKMGSKVQSGSSLLYNVEWGLPFVSDSVFLKGEANFKKFIKLKPISKYFKFMNLEYSANLGAIKSLNSSILPLNDCFSMGTIRGVNDISVDNLENQQNQITSFWGNNINLQAKSSIKLNFYNFPGLEKSAVIPFYHASAGYFYRVRGGKGANSFDLFKKQDVIDHFQTHLRATAGLGIGLAMGGGAKIELLYNFFHFSKLSDNKANLELRISIDD